MKSVIGNGSDLHAINNNPLIYMHVSNNNRYYCNAIQKCIATMTISIPVASTISLGRKRIRIAE